MTMAESTVAEVVTALYALLLLLYTTSIPSHTYSTNAFQVIIKSPFLFPYTTRKNAAYYKKNNINVLSMSTTTTTDSSNTSPIMAAYEATTKARNLQSSGALNAAVSAFESALSLHPTRDRYFYLAMAYEENGEPLKAVEMYELASQQGDDGGGDNVDAVLKHDASLKLAHVWSHDLGNNKKGLEYVQQALSTEGYSHSDESNAAAWDQMAYFLADEGRLQEAIGYWDKVIAVQGVDNGEEKAVIPRFFRTIAKALLGENVQIVQAELDKFIPPEYQYMRDSWNYAVQYLPQLHHQQQQLQQPQGRIFAGTYTMLQEAISTSRPDGLVCEFGVFHGKSIRLIASMVNPDVPVHGFDTFEGIPEAWGDEPAGTYTAAAELPQRVPNNVHFYVGLFSDTLPGYVASLPPATHMPVRMINVDCDLYQGTVEILHYLSDRIGPGSVLIFDEYLMTPTWPEDEYKAFQEACVTFGWEYEYIGFSLFSKQVTVRITKSESFVGSVQQLEFQQPPPPPPQQEHQEQLKQQHVVYLVHNGFPQSSYLSSL